MIRRPPLETKINHERWLVSYSDFITLLFAFFVVMYSVSQVSEAKYKQLSETLENAFSGTPVEKRPEHTESDLHAVSDANKQQANLADLETLQSELEGALEGLVQQSKVSLSGNEDWVEIEINANLIFNSAQAELSEEALGIFSEIAEIVSPYDNAVAVSGHTDNVPIQNSRYSNNWELSSARAVSVVDLLAYSGVNPQRLSAVGYGEYRPVADNTSEAGRAANRRVVLRVARDIAAQPAQKADALVESFNAEDNTEPETEAVLSPQDESEQENENTIQPIELDNGGLLFTSDPDSPRNSR